MADTTTPPRWPVAALAAAVLACGYIIGPAIGHLLFARHLRRLP